LQLKTTPVLFYDRGDVVFWSGEENQSVTDRAFGVSFQILIKSKYYF
jgi:hypothetical protein